MVCHGGFSLDEATRRSWYNPEFILKDLHPGMTFADIGCGDGFFAILAAKKVDSNGKVYALDIDASAIKRLKQRAETEGLTNITAEVGRAEEKVFCQQCIDFILYSMNLHDFSDPAKVLNNARQMVKLHGVVVDLDWKKIDTPFGPPVRIRFSEDYVARLLLSTGLTAVDIRDVGPYHYFVTAKRL